MPSLSFSKSSALFLCATALLCAADTRLVDQPPFAASPQDLLKEANNATPEKGENAIVLLDEDRWVFNKSGDVRRSMHVIVRLLTAQGVEQWSNLQWRWESWHQKRPTIQVRVITPDGALHTLDQSTVVDGPAGGQENNVYSDARAVKCPLPALTPGAVVEEEVEVESEHLLTGSINNAFFGRSVPVRLARAYIEYPDELPLRYTTYLLPDVKTTKTSEGGISKLTFEAGPLSPSGEVEPLLPPDVPRYAHILFSTGQSWKELAVAYNKIVEERVANTDVSAIVKAAKEGAASRAQLIERLVRQLHSQVRYTGVEFGDAAIIPSKPEDTLKRKYGDCKDKSALLVAMLRAAGIPSYLALLGTGPGQDVEEKYPGMGQFDHAIVYVPGSPDLWIDATADYLVTGFMPSMDQGRQALIIRPETTGLTMIPESPSSARVNKETREFYLPEFGKARVVEINEGLGSADSSLRANYGSADTEQLRKNLARYMRDEYLADAELKIDHPKGDDFSQPFRLRLEMSNANRGAISQSDGAVGFPLGALFENMPSYFKTEDKKPNAEESAQPPKKRTADFVMNEAFISERHYHIHMPPGFRVVNLPENQNLQWGPAKYSSAFHVEKDEIDADFRFDCGQRRYTAAEGEEVKKLLVEFLKKPVFVLRMQPLGEAYLEQGKVREAIEQYQSMTKQYPDKVIYRVRLSSLLLAQGCGHKAREEARRATEIDPKSALAYQNLGFILLNDLIGRQFAKGYDPVGAEAALRKAIELDPKDHLVSQRNLAVLFEHTPDGKRYTSPERLNEAIKIYREMGDELMANNLEANLLYDLTYAGRFQELRKELEKLSVGPLTLAFKLVATSKLEDSGAALAQAGQETSDEGTRSSALQTAGDILLAMREYSAAADLLAAGAKGAQNPTQLVARANSVRQVKRIDDMSIKTDTPENLMRSVFFTAVLGSDETAFEKLESPESIAGESAKDRKMDHEKGRRSFVSAVADSGLTDRAFLDFILSLIQFKVEENGKDGNRVQMLFPGRSIPQKLFVSRTGDAEYRVLGDSNDWDGVGRRILEDVKKGDLTAARRWLDWAREDLKIAGGDDPLDGPVFPRVWSKGSQGDEEIIRYAAAVLIGNSKHGKDAIPLLREAMEKAKAEPAKTYAQLAYVDACVRGSQWEEAIKVAKPLAAAHPESPRVAEQLMNAYMGAHRWQEAETVAAARLAKDSDELSASRIFADAKGGEGKFQEAEVLFRKLAESPKGTPSDWNSVGWFSLFAGDLTQEKITGLQQAMSGTPAPGMLHTLALMYAEAGKSTESRETILSAMRMWGLNEPDALSWLVFGRMAEQFGVVDEAISDYGKVEGKEEDSDSPFSSYALAQKRLAALKK